MSEFIIRGILGDVKIYRSSRDQLFPARLNMPLRNDDIVITYAESEVRLEKNDGRIMKVSELRAYHVGSGELISWASSYNTANTFDRDGRSSCTDLFPDVRRCICPPIAAIGNAGNSVIGCIRPPIKDHAPSVPPPFYTGRSSILNSIKKFLNAKEDPRFETPTSIVGIRG